MFYELPSWLYYLNILNILILVAYTLMFALLESTVLFLFTCLASLVLPERIFRERFVPQGCLLVSLVCLAAVSAQRRLGWLAQLQSWQIVIYPLAFILLSFVLLALSAWIFDRFPRIPTLVQRLAERITVFTYLYLPLAVLGLAVVLFRNLL